MLVNSDDYLKLLKAVSEEIKTARARTAIGVNGELVRLYWRIGRHLDENSDWGTRYLETLSRDIRAAFPGIKGFSVRSMKYMLKFAREMDNELCNSCCTIPWGHLVCLMDKTKPGEEREWYIAATIENGWSRAVLEHQIDSRLYERQALAEKATNFSRTLPAPESELAQQMLKDPYVFDFITARQSIDAPIGVSEYQLGDILPEFLADALPSPEDFENRL